MKNLQLVELETWRIMKFEKVRKFLTLSFSRFPCIRMHFSSVRELSLSGCGSVERIFPSKVHFREATANSRALLFLEFNNVKY